MNQKVLFITNIITGSLLLVALGLLILFGLRLLDANKVKEAAIASNLEAQQEQLTSDFQTQLETNTTEYVASDVFGSFSFEYPKVWSTNVTQDLSAKEQLVFLGDPKLIVFDSDISGPFTALRVAVYNDSYDSMVKDIESKYITKAKNPYTEKDVIISEVDGKRSSGYDTETKYNVNFVLLPLRDKTLYVGTDDSSKYLNNLETILKSLEMTR